MLAELDLMIRGAVIGISLLTFGLLCLSPESRRKSLSIGAIAVTLTAHMAETQGISAAWSERARDLAVMISHFMPMALTWFVLDIFLERTERRGSGVVLLVLSGAVTLLCFAPDAVAPVRTALMLALYAGLFGVVIVARQGDLVESRRSFRVVFVTLLVVFGVVKTLLDALISPENQPLWGDTAYALANLGFVVVFAYWALRPGADIWVDDSAAGRAPVANGADEQVLKLIDSAMQQELWRREGLTIGAMADEIGVPEHRLRKAINRDLGYRNFSVFVNGYRIDAAKAALAAPENAQTTILEIAYDVGFASLGPFNKAFRALTGTSPRDYRRVVMNGASIPA